MLDLNPLTEFDFYPTLAQTPGPCLVLFSSPTCGTCRSVEKRLPQAAAGLATALFKVDVQQSMGLARAYEVFHLPSLFLFVDGAFHAALPCEISADKLQHAVDAALALPAEEEP